MTAPWDTLDDRAFSAVVFDFDGLIIDTEHTALQSWQELYARFGEEVPLEKKWVTVIGTWDAEWSPRTELEQRLGQTLPWDELEAARRIRENELADAQPLLPGVAALLDETAAAGLRLAIASSSSQEWIEHHLGRLGIRDRFEVLATRHDVARTKPDPALYLLALTRLGVEADEAFALEDSVQGVRAAKDAGLKVVAVPGPLMSGQDFSAANVVVSSLAATSLAELAAGLRGGGAT